MKFDLLYKRALVAEQNSKKHEEDVEQFDHTGSVEEADEDGDRDSDRDYVRDDGYDVDFNKEHVERFSDVVVDLKTRPKQCVAEGSVIYTVTFERDDDTNSISSYIDDIVDYEELQVFLVGDEQGDAVEITDDLTPEEMEIVEGAIFKWLEKHID